MKKQLELLDSLWAPVRPMAVKLLSSLHTRDIEVQIDQTGALRTPEDQIAIYGEERFTLHYIGCALDIKPIIKCKPEDWVAQFNAWKYWGLYQEDLAVAAGFDAPHQWQLDRDRPHVQVLGGVSETVVRQIYYASNRNVEECRRYIELHWSKKV